MRDDISDVKSKMDVEKCKIQKLRGKFGHLISEPVFVVLNYVIWLIRNIVQNLLRKISNQKEEEK